jgi:hypothetical protein
MVEILREKPEKKANGEEGPLASSRNIPLIY